MPGVLSYSSNGSGDLATYFVNDETSENEAATRQRKLQEQAEAEAKRKADQAATEQLIKEQEDKIKELEDKLDEAEKEIERVSEDFFTANAKAQKGEKELTDSKKEIETLNWQQENLTAGFNKQQAKLNMVLPEDNNLSRSWHGATVFLTFNRSFNQDKMYFDIGWHHNNTEWRPFMQVLMADNAFQHIVLKLHDPNDPQSAWQISTANHPDWALCLNEANGHPFFSEQWQKLGAQYRVLQEWNLSLGPAGSPHVYIQNTYHKTWMCRSDNGQNWVWCRDKSQRHGWNIVGKEALQSIRSS